jgi:hypothetical protein
MAQNGFITPLIVEADTLTICTPSATSEITTKELQGKDNRSVFIQSENKSQSKPCIQVGPSDEEYGNVSLRAHQGDLKQNCPFSDRSGQSKVTVVGGKDNKQRTTIVPKGSIACPREVHAV